MISYLTSSATGYQLALSAYMYIHDVYLIFYSDTRAWPETQRLSSVQSSGSDLENKRQPTTQSGRAQGRASSGLLPGGDCEAAGGHRDSPEARASCGSRIVFFFFLVARRLRRSQDVPGRCTPGRSVMSPDADSGLIGERALIRGRELMGN